MIVVKANGERQEFSEKKILDSARRAGVPDELQKTMLEHVKKNLYENIPTFEIYHHILEFLNTPKTSHFRAKYSLKQAIMALGPTGYPFEDYVARVFQARGYITSIRNLLKGACITHEVDVVAEKSKPQLEKLMIEAKYHNNLGLKTEVHVAMYTWARFEDLVDTYRFTQALLITNTKITAEAIAYADCKKMGVIAWSYPEGESLRDLVEKHNLYPITTLQNLSAAQKQTLLENDVVLCRDICEDERVLKSLRISVEDEKRIYDEASLICRMERSG